ncbi:LLM class flavin-dependent oxidoreductase [Paractinoplanes atraurantiacus]|uniref:FMN-dependent oxidoreductase, nitrilotriacetate monooxygenase family n=1 Tax=Paractinoplanes atraurantiacus TaxID=1036182 RepID=A0A285HT36_9ACTN|nr:LLM class flavin-dependent oxidoreductase [Actinoplanes atraurantiacus]SNY38870.1 FMN-dependent oxidoreductase, nitrilotriacetate monooxygenase family [Actinoplanes atraurantiacus]
MTRKMHLNAFLMGVGHHEASWRLPESDPYASWDVKHFQELARIAERGKLDSIFFADSPVLQGHPGRRPAGKLEPTVLLTALAVVTERIGLIATASTSYNEPYNLARRFASIDHVSGGRAGWNIVTTAGADAARNFGLDDVPAHRDRYERAAEFVEVATKLWDSWADDAVLGDKEAGVHADAGKVRAINHHGRYFRVDGPLNVPRSPQGYSLLVQAGSSQDGREFAARWAEAVFTAQQTLTEGQTFYQDLKRRTAELGRDPEYARRQLAERFGLDPELLRLDEPLPVELLPAEDEIEGAKSRFTLIVDLAKRENLTVRQLIGRLGGGRGHRTFTGTPVQVADAIEEWFDGGAADGFNIMPAVLPSGLVAFVDKVVPILRERGRFRTEYTGTTLRDHYGLTRPANSLELSPV